MYTIEDRAAGGRDGRIVDEMNVDKPVRVVSTGTNHAFRIAIAFKNNYPDAHGRDHCVVIAKIKIEVKFVAGQI